jgi:metal-responsive CopG/Arc/MetJ family transcriptional regulator
MRKKIEIKVYLPYLMVGELESRRKENRRSKYIEEAIRSRLDGEESFSFNDITTKRLLGLLHARFEEDQVFKLMIQNRIKELAE